MAGNNLEIFLQKLQSSPTDQTAPISDDEAEEISGGNEIKTSCDIGCLPPENPPIILDQWIDRQYFECCFFEFTNIN